MTEDPKNEREIYKISINGVKSKRKKKLKCLE